MTVQEALKALSSAHQHLQAVTPAWINDPQPPAGDVPPLPPEYEDALVAVQAAMDDYDSARTEDGGDSSDADSTGTDAETAGTDTKATDSTGSAAAPAAPGAAGA